jgi:hypothetical protein
VNTREIQVTALRIEDGEERAYTVWGEYTPAVPATREHPEFPDVFAAREVVCEEPGGTPPDLESFDPSILVELARERYCEGGD